MLTIGRFEFSNARTRRTPFTILFQEVARNLIDATGTLEEKFGSSPERRGSWISAVACLHSKHTRVSIEFPCVCSGFNFFRALHIDASWSMLFA